MDGQSTPEATKPVVPEPKTISDGTKPNRGRELLSRVFGKDDEPAPDYSSKEKGLGYAFLLEKKPGENATPDDLKAFDALCAGLGIKDQDALAGSVGRECARQLDVGFQLDRINGMMNPEEPSSDETVQTQKSLQQPTAELNTAPAETPRVIPDQ